MMIDCLIGNKIANKITKNLPQNDSPTEKKIKRNTKYVCIGLINFIVELYKFIKFIKL